ncbi:MAG TPA: alpha/beta hydrolase [Arsenicitalea sp.]|jgi:acetyl esterase/lipase|nr:alpha/beta hydrolase [Arsenicitalea sp.]
MLSAEAKRELERRFAERTEQEPPLAERRRTWEAEALLDRLPDGAHFSAVIAGGVASEWMEVPDVDDARVFLLLHGGGYNAGSPKTHRKLAAHLSQATNMRVLVPDYRLAPEHPFPAGVKDALLAYGWLLSEGRRADDIIVGGDSAGGGLALSMLLALREAGGAMPRAAVLMAPWTDLSCSGESYETLRERDPIITRENLLQAAGWYAAHRDLADPMASPLFADLSGLPPMLIHAGGDEVMVDDSRMFAERASAAGVSVTCKIFPGLWHVFHTATPDVPESAQAIEEIGAFVRDQFEGAQID